MPGDAGSVRAGRAFVELGTNDSKLTKGLQAAANKLRTWGASISSMGQQLASRWEPLTKMLANIGINAVKNPFGLMMMGQRLGMGAEEFLNLAASTKELRMQLIQLRGIWRYFVATLGAVVIPILAEVAKYLVPIVERIAGWVRVNPQLTATIFKIGLAAVALGTALQVLGPIIGMVGTALGLLGSALGFLLFTPLGLKIAGIAIVMGGLAAAFLYFSGAAKDMKNTFGEAWGGIVEAVKSGDLVGAFQIVIAGVKALWADLVAAIKRSVTHIIGEVAALGIFAKHIGRFLIHGGKAPTADEAVRIAQAWKEARLAEIEAERRAAHAGLNGRLYGGYKRLENSMAYMADMGNTRATFNPWAALRFEGGRSMAEKLLDEAKKTVEELRRLRGDVKNTAPKFG